MVVEPLKQNGRTVPDAKPLQPNTIQNSAPFWLVGLTGSLRQSRGTAQQHSGQPWGCLPKDFDVQQAWQCMQWYADPDSR